MCGIAGAWSLRSRRDPTGLVEAMCEYMRRRGPDAAGIWTDPDARLCLGHRRLAIIDLDVRANQPMATSDGRYVITFNGEIYNYVALRDQLLGQGVKLRTSSDTEVILELYRRYGPVAFSMLRGMFAFGIWDADNRALVLVRDPYGIKPLYVADRPDGVMFASQVKALLASGVAPGEPDPAGLVGFFVWGSVPEPFTLFRQIQSVPAGSYVTVTSFGVSAPTLFAELASAWDAPAFSVGEIEEQVRAAVMDSVQAHLVADVPVAVLLSGGVDSGVIAGLMAELGYSVEGVTVKFDEFTGTEADESVGARLLSEHYRLRHSERRVTREEFLDDIPSILAAMDQPTVDGVNTWFASKAVAERGYKVVLSGVGGDELLCGYDTFRNIPRVLAIGRALGMGHLGGGMEAAFALSARVFARPKLRWIPRYAGGLDQGYLLQRAVFMPEELGEVLAPELIAEGLERLAAAAAPVPKNLGAQASIALLESSRYLRNQLLRDTDWASMAHSLEMRTPLADWGLLRRLAPYVGQLSGARGKRLLAAAPHRALPASIVSRRKTGFGLPMEAWLEDVRPDLGQAPNGSTSRWARGWAQVVAESFGLEVPSAARKRSVRAKRSSDRRAPLRA
jgi:asparagine synthase (glutamine-hydrolysing)